MPTFTPLQAESLLRRRYSIIEPVGFGGMGAVYLATDPLCNKKVAIKQMFRRDPRILVEAFEHEARILAQLTHPMLPKVSDYFVESDSQYLVMDYIEGEDLAGRFDGDGNCEPMEYVEARAIAQQLFEVLDFLHESSIVHRDIKPANIKVASDGRLILLDFGAAKGSLNDTTLFSVPVVTPSYAPPEQLFGLRTDHRSDVFSAGATIYHLLAGKPPQNIHQRENNIRISGIDPLRPLHEINPDVPVYFSMALHRTMSVDRQQRGTAREAIEALIKFFPGDFGDAYEIIMQALDHESLRNSLELQIPDQELSLPNGRHVVLSVKHEAEKRIVAIDCGDNLLVQLTVEKLSPESHFDTNPIATWFKILSEIEKERGRRHPRVDTAFATRSSVLIYFYCGSTFEQHFNLIGPHEFELVGVDGMERRYTVVGYLAGVRLWCLLPNSHNLRNRSSK